MISALAFIALAQLTAPDVNVKSLLPEMTDLARLAHRASPTYTMAQASSYDRNSKAPGDEAWFANADYGQYDRTEQHGDRTEYVMADLKGPGAVVRIWSANPSGTIRFYFDGEATPRFSAKMADLLTGKFEGLGDPFAYMASRGTDLYFPFPYAKSLVITSDANRNAASAALHIHEPDEQEQTPLELFQTMNAHVRRETAVDYNLGLRMPVLMHRQGLENVQARVSDAVRLLFPPVGGEEKERLFDALCADGLGYQPTEEEAIRRWRESLVARGVAPEAAAREVERELERDFLHRGREYHTGYTGLLSFSFVTVNGSQDSMPRTWNPAGGGCDA